MEPIPVLFIDAHALVIDKPAGLAVHPGPATRFSLEARLNELRFGFQRPPQPVHRLDYDTSGCLLLARNAKAVKRLSVAFAEGQLGKTYWAALDGVPSDDDGEIALSLAKVSSKEAGWRIVVDPRGKPARTEWKVLARAHGKSLVEFRPATGRTHQIRVHAAEGLGLPILGDPVYGRGPGRTLLHARRLSLPRAAPLDDIDVTAPAPPWVRNLGFEVAG